MDISNFPQLKRARQCEVCGVYYTRKDRYTKRVCGESCRHMIFVYGNQATDRLREEVLKRAEKENFFSPSIPWSQNQEIRRMKRKMKIILHQVRDEMNLESERYKKNLSRGRVLEGVKN